MKINSNELKNVIIIPGLGDEIKRIKLATSWWRTEGLSPHVVRIGWLDGTSDFKKKLKAVEQLTEELSCDGKISIVGTSAGGSASLNLLFERPDVIKNVVSICGRLRVGEGKKRIPANTFKKSEQYKQSVILIESREVRFNDELRKRVMTISPRYWDEYVPLDTIKLRGANNLVIPTVEHVFSIASALTFFAKPIIKFIKE